MPSCVEGILKIQPLSFFLESDELLIFLIFLLQPRWKELLFLTFLLIPFLFFSFSLLFPNSMEGFVISSIKLWFSLCRVMWERGAFHAPWLQSA